jgi:flavin reductase (DIM6/NTAB) family NADH-FMN oxidoreductase RutF
MSCILKSRGPLDSSVSGSLVRCGSVSVSGINVFYREVGVGHGLGRTGFTSTSVESLSAEPPRLLVILSEDSSSRKGLQEYPYFSVNNLCANHQELADQFAGRGGLKGPNRYRGRKWSRLLSDDSAILEGALVAIDCVVEDVSSRDGHAIVIGRVRAITDHADGKPPLYSQGNYRHISQSPSG